MLHHQNKTVNLLFVGPGDPGTISDLKRDISRYGLTDFCRFYGPCYDETITAKFLNMAAALVSPGPIGLGCIHALTYGTRVITNDNFNTQGPEIDAIIANVTGEFFKEGDSASLAECMRKLMDTPVNDKRILEICHKVIGEYFSPEYQLKIIRDAVSDVPASGWNWRQHLPQTKYS